ncbi:hypothetical protein RB6632 [Rhodopirellula baltica SH 1]|uniref:Uncharacterized protein n=1 Tax=Rhodopirellula baltica (strain DSM 10527 / NCIMB 13988 / SH1) TaxID=243090 RepID=Q7UPZ0_RHOBA|nr:hypothetical protein RB6632 [Rhodopirellula baltica SH 1]
MSHGNRSDSTRCERLMTFSFGTHENPFHCRLPIGVQNLGEYGDCGSPIHLQMPDD